MGILEGSKADVLTSQFGTSIEMVGAPLDVLDTFEDVPNLAITVPRKGKYLISVDLRGRIEVSTSVEGIITMGVTFTSQVVRPCHFRSTGSLSQPPRRTYRLVPKAAFRLSE